MVPNPDVVDVDCVAVAICGGFTVVGADGRPRIAVLEDFLSVLPCAHEDVLALVLQIGGADAISGQLLKMNGIDLHAADVDGAVGIPADRTVAARVLLDGDRAEDPRIDRVVGGGVIETVRRQALAAEGTNRDGQPNETYCRKSASALVKQMRMTNGPV